MSIQITKFSDKPERGNYYWIKHGYKQDASFTNESEAILHAKKLEKDGYDVKIVDEDKIWFRVYAKRM